ncbi:hypothetical protein AVEN_91893-2 [Araneus ventricosus]|uniref:Uncharacterized protein n=1 Tax=Araneus ventricosus TaxID=182803 RepID=A0A4Y2MQN1_ARAVE|nr:hypothetical protein AVEN_91893-2 [Araneus ventricosus]
MAAYQALLGNVSVAKPKQRSAPISDSDSEDEIENALANAVRRTSHIAFDAAILDPKVEKRKESIAEIKAERNTKSADSVSANKPQNKLSKNTRKGKFLPSCIHPQKIFVSLSTDMVYHKAQRLASQSTNKSYHSCYKIDLWVRQLVVFLECSPISRIKEIKLFILQ